MDISIASNKVFLAPVDSYDRDDLKKQVAESIASLWPTMRYNGKNVLLKPNLISSHGAAYSCTDGRFIAAVCEWFIDEGAVVSLGDSPAFGSARQVLDTRGITRQLAYLNVEVIEFKHPQTFRCSHDVEIGVAREALDCDLLVNLPKIKAHNQMYLTMAVKNLFGIVCGMRKAVAHMKNGVSHERFGDLMLDLTEIIGPSVTIADGIEAMHIEGPVNGKKLHLGCLAAGADPVGVDTAMMDVLELPHNRCPTWRAAHKRGFSGALSESLVYPRSSPSDFHGSGFIAPEVLNPVVFNPFRFFLSSVKRMVMKVRK